MPEAEPAVGDWRERFDSASLGIPAHITLLFPFLSVDELGAETHAELEALFAAQPAISFSLTGIVVFPDETVWLAPEPAEPFRKLTELIVERYPDHPPYGGIHDDIVPHLTVTSGDGSLHDQVEAAVCPHLPISAEARHVTLLVEDEDEMWSEARRYPLGA